MPEKLTHQEIAERVGASREMISRLLKDLERGGYLAVEGRVITLPGSAAGGLVNTAQAPRH